MGSCGQIRDRYDSETNETAFRYEKTRFLYDNGLTPATREDHLAASPTCALGHRGPATPLAPSLLCRRHDDEKMRHRAASRTRYNSAARAAHFTYKNLILAWANAAPCYESQPPGGVSPPLPLTPPWSRTHITRSPSWSVAARREFRVFSDTKKQFLATNGLAAQLSRSRLPPSGPKLLQLPISLSATPQSARIGLSNPIGGYWHG